MMWVELISNVIFSIVLIILFIVLAIFISRREDKEPTVKMNLQGEMKMEPTNEDFKLLFSLLKEADSLLDDYHSILVFNPDFEGDVENQDRVSSLRQRIKEIFHGTAINI